MNMKTPKITVMGSFVVDLMSRAPHLPVPGETVKGGPFKLGAGGKGSNQAVAVKKCGADVTMITKVGYDYFAEVALNNFKKEGINTDFIFRDKEHGTGTALILVDENTGENMILVSLEACSYITKEEILSAEEEIKNSDYVLTQLETNLDAVINFVELANKHNVKVVLNPAPYQAIPDELLSMVDIITPNETEASALSGVKVTGLESAEEAARKLMERGAKRVVITLGGNGSLIVTDKLVKHVKSRKVKVVDTTGAGDAFNGGFVVALAEGKDIVEAAEFASIVGALSVTKLGTAIALPTREEVENFKDEY